ncbi:hypothetical protein K7I13_11095 [Brucepastera parasyntrophica]|uniref:hypothetical protein n=1 Tax=Brucepastera parasyntrophica TaxID=2880008 RepID=UPI00210BD9B0|nr:hypothetical protein [Brucepastera parasyntrophica]ULQ59054.1 hypothetical protein K7I13_11095 [Brucepastera parasyntrophica]
MPQISKGGKFIFGWSVINNDLSVQSPTKAIEEYAICSEGKIILISGSRATGGFSVSKKELLKPSIFRNLFQEFPELDACNTSEGELYPYKGRRFAWLEIGAVGKITLTENLLRGLELQKGGRLLSIRSSNIAFTMGRRGRLINQANDYPEEIEIF